MGNPWSYRTGKKLKRRHSDLTLLEAMSSAQDMFVLASPIEYHRSKAQIDEGRSTLTAALKWRRKR